MVRNDDEIVDSAADVITSASQATRKASEIAHAMATGLLASTVARQQ